MKGIRISSRYAKSLLALSNEKGKTDEVFADMALVSSTIAENRDLKVLLMSPVIKPDTKLKVLNAIFASKTSEMSKLFIELLTKKGREGMLGEIADSYVAQVKEFKNVVSAHVVSAIALDDETRSTMKGLAAKLAQGKTIELTEKIDADLIGGFILQVGDHRVDASVSGEIKGLKREFQKNPYVPEF